MTYLLTEIALEMLGYKFYDIDGVPGPINFSNNAAFKHNKMYASEPNLADQLYKENVDNEKKKATASALSQLLSTEYKKMCKEIVQRRDSYPLGSYGSSKEHIDKREVVIQLRKNFIERELRILQKDSSVIREFTKLVEEVCKEINPTAHKHYTNTFDIIGKETSFSK